MIHQLYFKIQRLLKSLKLIQSIFCIYFLKCSENIFFKNLKIFLNYFKNYILKYIFLEIIFINTF